MNGRSCTLEFSYSLSLELSVRIGINNSFAVFWQKYKGWVSDAVNNPQITNIHLLMIF